MLAHKSDAALVGCLVNSSEAKEGNLLTVLKDPSPGRPSLAAMVMDGLKEANRKI